MIVISPNETCVNIDVSGTLETGCLSSLFHIATLRANKMLVIVTEITYH